LTLGVIGLGHVGLPLAALLALRGFKVVGYDVDQERLLKLASGSAGFYERDLEPLLEGAIRSGRISFTSDKSSLRAVDVPIITIGTPWDEQTARPDLSQLNAAIETLGSVLKKEAVVILKSTVAPGTTERMVVPRLEALSGLALGKDFGIVFSPERMIEGQAVSDYEHLPKIIGASDDRSFAVASKVFCALGGKVLRVSSPRAAEMVKMLDNYNRDGSIALVNQFALICMAASVDVLEVIDAAKYDYPRNQGLLIPGGGVGGSCLNKDPWILSHFAQENGIRTPLIPAFRSVNSNMPQEVVALTQKMLARFGLVRSKVVVAGLAFKSGTDDTRFSPGVVVIKQLLRLKCDVTVSDPYVHHIANMEWKITPIPNILEAATGSNLVIFMSDHDEYRKLDLKALKERMRAPAGLIDARHVINPKEALSIGFDFEGIGRPKEAFS
jgi:UDP-N-acetyl-D-mannosaminuronic acid dehydrogenase